MRSLSKVLRSIALSTLTGVTATSTLACGGEILPGDDARTIARPPSQTSPNPSDGFLPVPCEQGDEHVTDLASVRAVLGVDYIGVYAVLNDPAALTLPIYVQARSGSCSSEGCNALVERRLREALSRFESPEQATLPEADRQWGYAGDAGGSVPMSRVRAIVVVRDGNASLVGTDDELRALLGAMDSPWKAHLWLFATNHALATACKVGFGQSGETEQTAVRAPNVVRAVLPASDCQKEAEAFRVTVTVDASGFATETDRTLLWTGPTACAGRFPEAVAHAEAGAVLAAGCADEGAYFAQMAYTEQAAVHAFGILAAELAAQGAPRELLCDLEAARQDEIRHARMATNLARRAGREPATPTITPASRTRTRTLEEIAIENAVEGCVRETYGAVLGVHQGKTAKSANVRRVMAKLADDELRHAEVSWRLADWLDAKLDEPARARVRAARDEAILALRAQVGEDLAFGRDVGLPSVATALAIHERLVNEVWSV